MSYTPAFRADRAGVLDDIKACNEQPIGNGPYQMAGKWKHSQSITVAKWDGYAGDDAANADTIEFSMYSDLKTAYRDWEAATST
jgi:ABC-type oligopeptide transport system substrate-binding subunit